MTKLRNVVPTKIYFFKTPKLKMWQNLKAQILTKPNHSNSDKNLIPTKVRKCVLSKAENLNCDKTQELKLWPNSKSKILTKLKKLKLQQN